MDQISSEPVRHRVIVPIDGLTVAKARADAESLWIDPDSREARIDPDSREARFVVALEAPEAEWEAVVTFEVGAAGVVPTGVEVRSTQGQRVTRGVWDRVRLAEVIREAEALTEWLAPLKRGGQPLPASDRPRSPGRPRLYDDDHYRRVGAVYMAAKAQGKAPVPAVKRAFAEQFPGLTGQTDRRARSWVRAAKRLGFIAEPGKGEQS